MSVHWSVLVRAVAGFAIASASVLVVAAEAVAHSDAGLMTAEVAPVGEAGRRVEIRARVTYLNDGEPAVGATVTVQGVGPDGHVLPAEPLVDEGDGVFAGTVQLPEGGAWKMLVTSTAPNATVEVGYDAGLQPVPTSSGADTVALEEPVSGNDESGTDGLLLLVGLLLALILAGGFVAIVRNRRAGAG